MLTPHARLGSWHAFASARDEKGCAPGWWAQAALGFAPSAHHVRLLTVAWGFDRRFPWRALPYTRRWERRRSGADIHGWGISCLGLVLTVIWTTPPEEAPC